MGWTMSFSEDQHRHTNHWLPKISLALLCATQVGASWGQSIYTCVDARGRRITADRPIVECLDRDQTEMTKSGTVKRVLQPSMTADEREAYEEKVRQEVMEQNRRAEERRRNRALLARYPNKPSHDKERLEALLGLDAATESAKARLVTLQLDKKKLDDEMEFYRKDPSKAPYRLRQQVTENQVSIEAQHRFLEGQTSEAARVNARFDEELATLKDLWLARALGSGQGASAAAPVKK
jgi:hypothetical protein